MYYLTSEKTVKWARIAGCIGILCFFLPTLRISIFGETDSRSGFKYILEFFEELGDLESESIAIGAWLGGALVAGIVGVVSANRSLFSAIADVVGVVCLFLLRDEFISATSGIGSTAFGWTLTLIAYILAAAFAFASCYLAGKEYATKRPGGISAMSDEDFNKLRKELKDIRIDDDDKK